MTELTPMEELKQWVQENMRPLHVPFPEPLADLHPTPVHIGLHSSDGVNWFRIDDGTPYVPTTEGDRDDEE